MSSKNMYLRSLMLLPVFALFASCEKDNEITSPEGGTGTKPGNGIYPAGSIVWKKDTTVFLTDHFLVKKDQSLYVEEGAKIIASNSELKPEIVVLGNLYCMGTATSPIVFSVEESSKNDRFSRNWGGIICGYDSREVYLNHTTIEYGGAQTTDKSLSFINELFKTETGEGVPGLHFCNPQGALVIINSTFRNNAEDHLYITGGKSIIANNKFITNGFDGGEAINYKSECLADLAYNLIYDANTNAFKLSNSGFQNIQSHLYVYNNTILNSGWRRPKVKGGSIWLEQTVLAKLYNNLIADCRWGLKQSIETPMSEKSEITPNFYFASTEAGVNQMQGDDKTGISNGLLNGSNDRMSESAGDKNPLFAQFEQQENIDINVSSNAPGAPVAYCDEWSFQLKENSPALTGGITDFTPHFAKNPIVLEGLSGIIENQFRSPVPSAYFGAFGL
ncbi:MAG: right-handed parallel beta-helix repeat-containing protein [Bacteroidales bacterium]